VQHLEARYGLPADVSEVISEEQLQAAMTQLKDEEMALIDQARGRLEIESAVGSGAIPYSELTDEELRAFIRLYKLLLGTDARLWHS
jgi:hypothetical protein